MKAVQAGAQMDQFRTNLAERARQFNEGLDLQRDQVNAAVARDNAYVKKLEFDLKTQSDAFNREAIELEELDKFTALISKEYTENASSLSLPPPGLTGERFEMAMSVREAAYASQKRSLEYQAVSQDRADEMDLIRNYGLPANYKSYEDEGVSFVQEARNKRNMMEADAIASKYGTTPADVIQADPSVSSIHLSDYRGNLNKALWEGIVQRVTGRMQTSRATSPSGSTQYSINTTNRSTQSNTQKNYREIVDQATKMATIKGQYDGDPDYVDADLRDKWIQHLREPDKYPVPKETPSKAAPEDDFSRSVESIMNRKSQRNFTPGQPPTRNGQLGY